MGIVESIIKQEQEQLALVETAKRVAEYLKTPEAKAEFSSFTIIAHTQPVPSDTIYGGYDRDLILVVPPNESDLLPMLLRGFEITYLSNEAGEYRDLARTAPEDLTKIAEALDLERPEEYDRRSKKKQPDDPEVRCNINLHGVTYNTARNTYYTSADVIINDMREGERRARFYNSRNQTMRASYSES
jgi:hypothetical protein